MSRESSGNRRQASEAAGDDDDEIQIVSVKRARTSNPESAPPIDDAIQIVSSSAASTSAARSTSASSTSRSKPAAPPRPPPAAQAKADAAIKKWTTDSKSTSNSTARRLTKELREMTTDAPDGCTAVPNGDNLFHWICTIDGPPDTPYAGGRFTLDVKFTQEYPFKPPQVTFKTRIYHCNINSSGGICLDTLKNNWSPALTTGKVLLSIVTLLCEPNPSDPLVHDIAQMYLRKRKQHDKIAREWTLKYAEKAPNSYEPIVL
eukprot:Partr_v1_DN26226_c1_g1_i2_m48664 putative ubiquitin-conjugating enzyme E2E